MHIYATVETAKCRHWQKADSDLYYTIHINTITDDGHFDRRFVLRTSESGYAGNTEMLQVYQEIVRRINAQ